MRLSTARRRDDADVIRARLRVLLDTAGPPRGWLPDIEPDPPPVDPPGASLPVDDDAEFESPVGAEAPGGRHRRPGPAVRWDPGRRGVRALWGAGLLAALLLAAWAWADRPRTVPVPSRPVAATAVASSSAGTAGRTGARSGVAGVGASPSEPPRGAAGQPATVVVSVVGPVARPGVVTLPAGARVTDAVAAAGGLLPQADPASVNLAAPLVDGQQVAVGTPGAPPSPPAAAGAGASSAGATGPVDLNAATVADLDALSGIGPVLAQRIVDYRTEHGRFATVDQLDDVPGIGPTLYARLVGRVRV